MSCNTNCALCNRIIKTTAVTLTSGEIVLTIPSTITPVNLKEYCLIICQSMPSGASTQQVTISNGTTTYNLLCSKGNYVRADQICTRRKYKIVYGADPVHFTVESCLPRTSYINTSTSSDTESNE